GQAAVEHEPAVGPLDRPTFRDGGESSGSGGALDDFEVDAEGGGVLDEVFAVATVDPDLADRGMSRGHLVEEGLACGGVLDTGCGDQDRQQETEGVGDDAPLAADDLFSGVHTLASGGDTGRGFDALRVDYAGSWFRASALPLPHLLP